MIYTYTVNVIVGRYLYNINNNTVPNPNKAIAFIPW